MRATVSILCREGYAATTTTRVEEHAGVSRGALLYHFPTRATLLSAAVDVLFAELRQEFEVAFARLARSSGRHEAALDLLWRIFRDPRVLAVVDLYLAARTERELANQLDSIVARHEDHVAQLVARYFPEVVAGTALGSLVPLIFDALQGMAIRRLGRPDDPTLEASLACLKQLVAVAADAVAFSSPAPRLFPPEVLS